MTWTPLILLFEGDNGNYILQSYPSSDLDPTYTIIPEGTDGDLYVAFLYPSSDLDPAVILLFLKVQMVTYTLHSWTLVGDLDPTYSMY